MTERKSMESERAELVALSDVDLVNYCGDDASKWAEVFCRLKHKQGWSAADIDESLMLGWFANAIERSSDVRSLAAQDQKPFGWLGKDGKFSVPHETTREQFLSHFADHDLPTGTPVIPLYLSPPPAAGWDEKSTRDIRWLVSSARAFLRHFNPCNLAEDKSQQWQSLSHQCDVVERALRHNAPPDSGVKLIDAINSRGLKGARKQATENHASMLPYHGGADAGVRKALQELRDADAAIAQPQGDGEAVDLRDLVLQQIKRARKAGESQEMLARWICEVVRPLTYAPPTDSRLRRALERTVKALSELRDAVERSGKLNGREYVSLGIHVNGAIAEALKALRAGDNPGIANAFADQWGLALQPRALGTGEA